jgi:hypothetical protein
VTLDRVFIDLAPEQIRTLLVAIAARLDDGFTAADAEQFCTNLVAAAVDDDLLIEPGVTFRGARLPFAIDAFKGESESVELVFFAPAVLADLVESEVRATLGDVGVRRVPTKHGLAE